MAEAQAVVAVPEQAPVVEAPKLTPIQKAVAAYDKVRAEAAERAKAAQEAPKPAEKPAETPEAPAEEPKKEEITKEEPVVEPEKPAEPLSAKFALVAKLEMQAREKLKSAKAKEDAAVKRVSEIEAKLSSYEQAKANAKLNPVAWLEQAGISYEEATQFVLNWKTPTPQAQHASVRAEIEAFKKQQTEEQERLAKTNQEQAQAQHQQNYRNWITSVVDFVKTNAAEYVLINKLGKHELVPAIIQKQYEDTSKQGKPIVLSEKEAASLVEQHLQEEDEAAAKRVQERVKTAPQVQQAAPEKPKAATLSNGLTASTPALNGAPRKKTWEQKREAALLAMENARKA